MDGRVTRVSLLERLKDVEDQSAWRDFDERYGGLIVAYAVRRGLQWADAEDVRQRVLLELAKRLPRFRYHPELGRFRNYLGVTVRRAVCRHLRREGRTVELESSHAPADGDDLVWEREWMLQHYRLAMAKVRRALAPGRLALLDDLLAGRPVAEIARARAISPQAISKFKRRVRERARAFVDQQVHDEELPAPPG